MRAMIGARRRALLMTLLTAASCFLAIDSIDWIWSPVLSGGFAVVCWTRFKRVRGVWLDDQRWFQGVMAED